MHRFYKYTSSEFAQIILSDFTLKFTHPNKFNDPFDYYPTSSTLGANKFVKRVINQRPNTGRIKTNFKSVLKNSALLRSQQFRDITAQHLCITCFSSTQFSLPMWAHYANNHKGCVIGFRDPNEEEARSALNDSQLREYFHLVPFEVTYTDDRPFVFDKNGLTNTEKNGYMAVLKKAKAWEYEQEVRAIRLSSEGIFKFNPLQVVEVYLGMKMEKNESDEVIKIIKEINKTRIPNIKIFRIVMEHNTYNLTRIRL